VTPSLIPPLALFVVESHNLLEQADPPYAKQVDLQNKQFVNYMRMKAKLFGDQEIREALNWAARYQEAVFFDVHTGPLAALKRRLQKDLSLSSYAGHLVLTSHLLFLYLTANEDRSAPFDLKINKKLGTVGRKVSFGIGRYLGQLHHDLVINAGLQAASACVYRLDDRVIRMDDVKSSVYLQTVFNGPASRELNLCLIMFLAYLNVTHYIMRGLVIGSPLPFFKIKYMTLYHVYLSLKNAQSFFYPHLTEASKEYLRSILLDKDLRLVVEDTNRRPIGRFRNALVHYGLAQTGLEPQQLDPNAPLFGMVAHFFDGATVDELDSLVDRQLERVSELLERWAGNS
jgi:hypothetical protein